MCLSGIGECNGRSFDIFRYNNNCDKHASTHAHTTDNSNEIKQDEAYETDRRMKDSIGDKEMRLCTERNVIERYSTTVVASVLTYAVSCTLESTDTNIPPQ